MNKIKISKTEEQEYIKNSINSSKLLQAIKKEKDDRIYIFIPYLYGTTYFGCLTCPQNSIMIPCLHDESYAYMEIFKDIFSNIRGLIFNSQPEKELASKIFDNLPSNIVTGGGVDLVQKTDSNHFKNKFNLEKFVLYAGRKDPAKNVDTLIDYYSQYVEKNGFDFELVLTGPGTIDIPSELTEHIHSILLSKEDLYDAYSAAIITCQPSLNESFSLSIMESWLCGTPVLVHEGCSVTKDHCLKNNGGLYFSNFLEFEACLKFFLKNPQERKIMANNGKNYVLENFSWGKIVNNYTNFVSNLFE